MQPLSSSYSTPNCLATCCASSRVPGCPQLSTRYVAACEKVSFLYHHGDLQMPKISTTLLFLLQPLPSVLLSKDSTGLSGLSASHPT